MSRLAWLQFYPRDWTADTGLRSVSIAARGLWIEVLCIMHQSPDRGYLLNTLGGKIDAPQLARAVGEPVDTVAALLAELEAAGVFSRDDRGVIVSRRMVRDESFRAKCREVGKLGGNPSLIRKGKGQGNRGVNPPVNLDPTTGIKPHSSEFREQRTEEEANASSCPEPAEPATGPNDETTPTAALAVPTPEPAPDPVLAEFPATGPGSAGGWPLHQSKLKEWEGSYPTIDVRGELRKARQWLRDNPGKRKTMSGMQRFLSAWLSRAVDRPRTNAGPAPFDRGAAADQRITGQIAEALPEIFTHAQQ